MKRYYNTKGSAERIRQLRKRSHVTQSMLAEQANISVDTVKRLERGNEGSVNVLLAIADMMCHWIILLDVKTRLDKISKK